MPLPLIPFIVAGVAAASAAVAGKKGYDSIQNVQETKTLAVKIERNYKEKYDDFEQARNEVNREFENYGGEKFDILEGSMSDFVAVFSKLKNVDFTDNTIIDNLDKVKDVNLFMQEVEKQTIAAGQVLKAGITSVAGGGLAAMGALGAATTFGAASTGTAIASLSGVAATNATLAFFGGGSLAAGGLGMAGGMAVLGGIALAPALAIGSLIFAASTEKKLEKMKTKQVEIEVEQQKLQSAKVVMTKISRYTKKMRMLAVQVNELFEDSVDSLSSIIERCGIDYQNFSETQKVKVQQTYMLAVTMKHLLDTAILDGEGELSSSLTDVIEVTTDRISGI